MQMVVIGGSQNRRVVEDAVTLQGFIRNNAEILLDPVPEPELVPPVTEEEMENLMALRLSLKKEIGLEEVADAVEELFEELQNESPFEEEMRSFERFASQPRSSCGHLPSLAVCEKECEMNELAGNAAVPLKRNQDLMTLFTRRPRTRRI